MKYLLLMMTIILLIINIGCSNKSESNSPTDQLSLLKAKLVASENFKREDPFQVRQFQPYDSMSLSNYMGISYGCYREGQAPGKIGPTEDQILEDLNIIRKNWHLIRVYGADDDTERILKIIDSNNLYIKVLLGVWLEPEANNIDSNKNNIEQAIRAIELTQKYPQIITAINVGNETQVYWSWHKMKPENLTRYIRAIRSVVDVPVTTADDYNFWNKDESVEIENEIDFVVTHMHPLWNGKTVDEAIPWLDSTFKDIQAKHPYRLIVLGETGWATSYDPTKIGNGEQGTLVKGDVSIAAQTQFLLQLNAWIKNNKNTTFIFEAFDEPWKGGGETSSKNDIEKHWGIFYENRQIKDDFINNIY